jgi:UDP-glucose 4-epimerase
VVNVARICPSGVDPCGQAEVETGCQIRHAPIARPGTSWSSVLKGQDPLHILGAGEQVRHYTYGGDLAAGTVTAMEHPSALNEDVNLSCPQGTTVAELAELIWRKVHGPHARLRIVHDPPFEHDVQRRIPATGKARRLLGFEAATALPEMLDEVIPWVAQAIEAGTI